MSKILSIIVPSYNMEAYLPKCLGSLVVEPGLMDLLEVLVVNDGSKDRTSAIAHEFADKWPNTFRVIDKQNGHYGSCINAGLKVATGTYVKVLDADDWFDTGVFSRYLQFLSSEVEKVDASDLVLNDFDFIDDAGMHSLRKYDYVKVPGFSLMGFAFGGAGDLWMHAVAYKTDLLRKIGYRQMEGLTHSDIQWIHTPMSSVKRIAYCPGALYIYQVLRVGNTSDSVGFYKTFHDIVRVTEQLLREYEGLVAAVEPEQKAYLTTHLRYRVRRIYYVYLQEQNPLLKCGVLEEFDSFLKQANLMFYDEMDGLTCGSAKRGFHYVRDWRRHKTISWRRKLYEWAFVNYGKIRQLMK